MIAAAVIAGLTVAAPWGMAVGLYPRGAEALGLELVPDLGELRALGADSISLPVAWSQADLHASRLAPDDDTVADADLAAALGRGRALGLTTALVPHVTLRAGAADHWRGKLAPRDEDRWWRSYTAFILHYARLARAQRVELFVVGSELSSLQGAAHRERWRTVIGRVRAVYPGRIVYVANHDALDDVAPFALVDVAGVSAYFPLSTKIDATQAELSEGWWRVGGRLRSLKRQVQRPLVLFEVGYPSIDGAATAPWDYTIGAPIDLEEQRRAYRAAADALLVSPWIDGAYFWIWFGAGGPYDRHYTPRDKPAERELGRLFRAVRPHARREGRHEQDQDRDIQ